VPIQNFPFAKYDLIGHYKISERARRNRQKISDEVVEAESTHEPLHQDQVPKNRK
jgi:hypothetical protein